MPAERRKPRPLGQLKTQALVANFVVVVVMGRTRAGVKPWGRIDEGEGEGEGEDASSELLSSRRDVDGSRSGGQVAPSARLVTSRPKEDIRGSQTTLEVPPGGGANLA
ncbi:hypothetical protein L210DRAFT_3509224 [Boletus edulis BED1]|uniref:Uncharacterized protein n=1 Tax=Boletus edulis BED1 TaxID=1328754 RepID=A0AAD4BFD4_BOLED|nr:hypothetical protein L210DRAFT_3509224 [Boletus edulis BED1]